MHKTAVEFDGIDGHLRFDEIEQCKMSLSMQEVFHIYEKDMELITKLNFEISELNAGKELAYSDGEFIKSSWSCSLDVRFQKKMCSGPTTVSLSQFAVARQIDELSKNIELSLKQKISKSPTFSIALGKNTDFSNTVQLVFWLSH